MQNAFFGSTLTDAQRAVSDNNRLGLEGDIARRAYLAQILQAANQRQNAEAQNQRFAQELGFRQQEAQANALLRTLAMRNQQEQMQQDAALQREALINALNVAKVQFPKERWQMEGDRAKAEEVRQRGIEAQNMALMNDEIDQHNTSAEAAAARYNALLGALTDEKDTMFTARSTAQKQAWRDLLDAMKVGGDDKFIKPEISADPKNKELQYKFVPIIRQKRTVPLQRPAAPMPDNSNPNIEQILKDAQDAISRGADPGAVGTRLRERYNVALPSAAPIGSSLPYNPEEVAPFLEAIRSRGQPLLNQRVLPIPGMQPQTDDQINAQALNSLIQSLYSAAPRQ